MQTIFDFIHQLHSADGLRQLIQTGGLIVIIGIIFAETGLLAGFFLPGDSLLVTAGIFASSEAIGGAPIFNLPELILALILAAFIGDQLGYYLGHKSGPYIYRREDTFFFKKNHLITAQEFYQKHGPRALIAARFVPILRTFVPFVAGMANMEYKKFVVYNAIGAIVWIVSLVLVGYFLGQTPLANRLHEIILVVIFISILPILITAIKKLRRA